ncbi:MAG: aminodeoxychorismate/anthranilate synthase component II [Acidimicrobiia bacterium]|nr:aminodeoxychorismate/anthranilate synthase component II [Acidimicrobiia bacterium]
MRVLVVDNYDSFVYNLVQYIGELGADPVVYRNDAPELSNLPTGDIDRIVISPGPGRPESAGASIDVVKNLGGEIPTLGVCLGHQVIATVFGGIVERAPEPRHGKTSSISHDGSGVFAGISNPFEATRYHSLAVTEIPDELIVTATSEDGVIQGLRHKELPIEGVQFHPESVMTTEGMQLLANFLAV